MSDEEVLDRMTLSEELAYACEKLEDLSKLRTKSKVKDRRESFMNSVKNVSTWLKPPPQINKVRNQQLDERALLEEKKIRQSQLLVEKKHIPKRNKHTMAAIMDNYGYNNDFQDIPIPNREVYEADLTWSQYPEIPTQTPSTSFIQDDGSGDAVKYNADNTQDEDYMCDKLDKCKVFQDEELPVPANTPADHLLNRGDVELDPNRSERMFQEQFKKFAYYASMMNKMDGKNEFDLYDDEEPVQTLEPSFQQNNYAQTAQKQHVPNYGSVDPNADEAFSWRNMHPPISNPSSPIPKYPYSSKSIRSMNKNRRANNCPDAGYFNEHRELPNNDSDTDGYYMAIVKGRNGQNQYVTKAVETNNYYVQPQKPVKLISRQSALTSILTGDDGKLMTGPLAVAMIKEHQKCSNKLFSSFRTGGEGRNNKSYLNSLNADVRNLNARSGSQSHLNPNIKVVDALSSPRYSKQPIYGVKNVAGSPSKQEPIEFTVGVIKHRPINKKSTVAPTKTIISPNKSNVMHGKGDQTNGKGVSVRKTELKGNATSTQLGPRKPFSSITGRKHTTGAGLHMTPETKNYTASARRKPTSKNNKTKPETDMRVGNEKVNSLLAKMMSPQTAPYSIAPNETKITTKKLKIPNSTRL